ncbi:MAG TPA: hypothetical protein VIH59_31700 [Candidatus Tectomicrobia bacterium]
MKAYTLCIMFLGVVASLTFAQSRLVPQTDTAQDRASTDQPIMVAQAPARAEACINPKTGQPDQLVQCAVAPCHAFEPPSPFVTCIDNYCGGCHAILCGILLEDVSGGLQPSVR